MGFKLPTRVQELFLSGERARAIAAVPDELADELGLFGPPARIRERLRIWRESPVISLILGGTDRGAREQMLHLIREDPDRPLAPPDDIIAISRGAEKAAYPSYPPHQSRG